MTAHAGDFLLLKSAYTLAANRSAVNYLEDESASKNKNFLMVDSPWGAYDMMGSIPNNNVSPIKTSC